MLILQTPKNLTWYNTNMKKAVELQIVVWKEGKDYVAQCLNVDVSSFGSDQKEALANIQEALELYFEDSSTNDIQIVEKPTVVTQQLQYA